MNRNINNIKDRVRAKCQTHSIKKKKKQKRKKLNFAYQLDILEQYC